MALSEAFTFSALVSTTELSIISGTSTLQNNTTIGVYQLFLDLSPLVNGDVFEVKIYEKVRSTSTKRVVQIFTIANAQSQPNFVTDSFILVNGWDMTIVKLSGTDRTIEGSIRKAA